MTPEQLLKQRYKVIAEWPGCNWYGYWKNDIIIIDEDSFVTTSRDLRIYELNYEDFPHLFKPLKWWEDRKFDELPKYFKWPKSSQDASFFNVDDWYTSPNTGQVAGIYNKGCRFFIEDCEPITESEYLESFKLDSNEETKNLGRQA